MSRIDKCAKCGSSAVAQRAMVVTTLHGFVCSACGCVEFYVDDPKALYDAFLAAQEDTPSKLTGNP